MIDYYGAEDIIWQFIRLGLVYFIVSSTIFAFNDSIHWTFSAVVGMYFYHYFIKSLNWVLYHVLGLEALGSYDYIFLLDDRKNISNIVGNLFFEEFDFKEMKQYLLNKTADLHKCRSKLVKRFGVWWYLKMDAEESLRKI